MKRILIAMLVGFSIGATAVYAPIAEAKAKSEKKADAKKKAKPAKKAPAKKK